MYLHQLQGMQPVQVAAAVAPARHVAAAMLLSDALEVIVVAVAICNCSTRLQSILNLPDRHPTRAWHGGTCQLATCGNYTTRRFQLLSVAATACNN